MLGQQPVGLQTQAVRPAYAPDARRSSLCESPVPLGARAAQAAPSHPSFDAGHPALQSSRVDETWACSSRHRLGHARAAQGEPQQLHGEPQLQLGLSTQAFYRTTSSCPFLVPDEPGPATASGAASLHDRVHKAIQPGGNRPPLEPRRTPHRGTCHAGTHLRAILPSDCVDAHT